MHPLKAWLRAQGLSLRDFAARLNARGARTRRKTRITAIYLSQVLTGYRRPLFEVAQQIEAETSAAVTAIALMSYQAVSASPTAVEPTRI